MVVPLHNEYYLQRINEFGKGAKLWSKGKNSSCILIVLICAGL